MVPLVLIHALLLTARADMPVDIRADAAPDVLLDVELECGSVTIQGSDAATVHVTGTVRPDLDRLHVRGSGRRVSISMERGRDACAWLTVTVPTGTSLRGESVRADFAVGGLSGDLYIESVSGNVGLDGNGNEIEVTTVSGPITVLGSPRRVEAESVSGEIRIRAPSVTGIELATVSSDMRIKVERVGEIKAESVSGDIELIGRIEREAGLESVSGDVTLRVPKDQGMILSTSSFSGHVRGLRAQAGLATFGDGIARVRIETFSGQIDVESP